MSPAAKHHALRASDPMVTRCGLVVPGANVAKGREPAPPAHWHAAESFARTYPWERCERCDRASGRPLAARVLGEPVVLVATKRRRAATPRTLADPRDEGCLCHGCGRRYKVDFLVPDDLWDRIRPAGSSGEGGLLCGPCVAERVEALGEFGAWRMERVS